MLLALGLLVDRLAQAGAPPAPAAAVLVDVLEGADGGRLAADVDVRGRRRRGGGPGEGGHRSGDAPAATRGGVLAGVDAGGGVARDDVRGGGWAVSG